MNETRDSIIREAYERLSQSEKWKSVGKTQRLYMLCVEVNVNHITLQRLLKELEIEL